jgi:uncharacterized DUF497 family protein
LYERSTPLEIPTELPYIVRDDRFEWDDAKARANLEKHEVSFEVARRVFYDTAGIDEIDDRGGYGEDRFIGIGMVDGRLLTVTYTERDGRIRIISARKATRREQDDYFGQDL